MQKALHETALRADEDDDELHEVLLDEVHEVLLDEDVGVELLEVAGSRSPYLEESPRQSPR